MFADRHRAATVIRVEAIGELVNPVVAEV